MSTWYDAFGAEYNASNWNSTDQSQNNPTVVAGGHVGPVDVSNSQSNATSQIADAGSFGHFSPFSGGQATNFNETHQDQSNPTVVLGGHVGPVDVHNDQSNATYQQADAHSGGYFSPYSGGQATNFNETQQDQTNPTLVFGSHVGPVDVHNSQSNATFQDAGAGSGGFGLPGFHGFGPDAININVTTQVQADPTIVVGDHVGPVTVDNSQSNATFQQADAGSGGFGFPGFHGFGSDASNFNATTQVQNDPTIVLGDHIGSVDVHNSQSNGTEQLALADHHFFG